MSAHGAETILLTIFLRHDQSKNLDSIQGHLASTGWWERFPPKGVEIVSWNVVMGIGQIVTLRLPPHLLNVVNVEIERCASHTWSQRLWWEGGGSTIFTSGDGPNVIPHCPQIADPSASSPRRSAIAPASEPPIIARVEEECVMLDLRTVLPEQDQAVVQALVQIEEN